MAQLSYFQNSMGTNLTDNYAILANSIGSPIDFTKIPVCLNQGGLTLTKESSIIGKL